MESILRHDPIVVVTAKNKTRLYNYFQRRSKIYNDDASERKVSFNDYSLTSGEKLSRDFRTSLRRRLLRLRISLH